jgi:diketogulonate reductase-like aldo/keto reductase
MSTQQAIPAVELGRGVSIPAIGLGTYALRGRRGYQAMRTALDLGYRHLDTATMYRNEAEVGRAVADSDLWLIHWPPAGSALVSAWRAVLDAREAGLARAVGVSNFSLAQLDEVTRATGQAPSINQVDWSPSRHDPAYLAGMRDRGVVAEGYSPLKGSSLRNPVLRRIADRHRVTSAQVVLRWHLEHGIVIIPKSGDPGRQAANLDLAGFTLDPAEVAEIDGLSRS